MGYRAARSVDVYVCQSCWVLSLDVYCSLCGKEVRLVWGIDAKETFESFIAPDGSDIPEPVRLLPREVKV